MSEVEGYADALARGEVTREPGALPPHWPTCFGCGPDNAAGLHVVARKDGDEIRASYAFAKTHEGAPGIAHGGAVAALVDDVCGFLLFVIREPAVTRKLEVEYLKPVLVGETYELAARIDSREGRKLFVSCEGTRGDGTLVFRGSGLFVTVDFTHFSDKADGSEPPVAL